MWFILWIAIAVLLIIIAYVTVIAIVLSAVFTKKRSGFTSRPTNDAAKKYAAELYANAHLIRDGYKATKNKLPWLDPITFEDVRKLQMNGNISPKMFESLFINV